MPTTTTTTPKMLISKYGVLSEAGLPKEYQKVQSLTVMQGSWTANFDCR